MSHELASLFDEDAPLTIGVEEELMLLDPASLDLAARSRELLERVAGDPRFKLELPAAQFEIVSPPLAGASEAAEFLGSARADLAVAADGIARLASAGVHPFAAPEGELNAGQRYRWALERYGRVVRYQLVFGLQVHVAVRGRARALAVYNALRSYLPEILALAANSPLYRGEDTGLAAVRPKIAQLLPRQGVPPSFASWDEFAGALHWGQRAGALPDHRFWWWELRPHPAFGTLEVRVADAQTTVADAAAVIALVHSLCAWLAERHDAGDRLPVAPTWRIEENRWAALSDGIHGTLVDVESGEQHPARERLEWLLEELSPVAERLGCHSELAHATALARENGADHQRAHAAAGTRALVDWLALHYADRVEAARA